MKIDFFMEIHQIVGASPVSVKEQSPPKKQSQQKFVFFQKSQKNPIFNEKNANKPLNASKNVMLTRNCRSWYHRRVDMWLLHGHHFLM